MYLLDTDHLSFLQSKRGTEYDSLQRRIPSIDPGSCFASVVSFHEQMMGWNALLQRAKSSTDVVRGYAKMAQAIDEFAAMEVLPFDTPAADVFENLRALRIGVMDLRIAAIAISRNIVLLTRNFADFGRVPGLRYEDWTIPEKPTDS